MFEIGSRVILLFVKQIFGDATSSGPLSESFVAEMCHSPFAWRCWSVRVQVRVRVCMTTATAFDRAFDKDHSFANSEFRRIFTHCSERMRTGYAEVEFFVEQCGDRISRAGIFSRLHRSAS